MTPSEAISTSVLTDVTDTQGRRIALRRLTALDRLRLFKAAGPNLAHNDRWLGMAILAVSVAAIDDIPVPMPANEYQIEALVHRLGDSGIAAVATALEPEPSPRSAETLANAGN